MESDEIVRRLWAGKLKNTDLPSVDGRKVLSQLTIERRGWPFRDYAARAQFRDLHFDKCTFNDVMFVNARFSNCVFSDCRMPGVGFWKSIVADCSFRGCDLRNVAFGGLFGKLMRPNEFPRCKFERCDLRDSAHSYELYEACMFQNCNLYEVDFQGAVFDSCTFSGKVAALFHRKSMYHEGQRIENTLKACDFSKADVSEALFINLDLDLQMFGENPDIIALMHGPKDWRDWAENVDKAKFPGIDIYVRETSDSGSPTIASVRWLEQAGFSAAEIDRLRAIGKGK